MWNYRNFDNIKKQSDTYKNTHVYESLQVFKYSGCLESDYVGSFFAERIGKEKTTVFNFIFAILNFYAECVVLQTVDSFAVDMLASYGEYACVFKYTCLFKYI